MLLREIKAEILMLIFFLLLIFLFFSAAAVNGENYEVIFNHLDAEGDDYGAGDYYYPKNHIFQNKGNLFDLKALTILESEAYYKLEFAFSKLTDPWGAKYGFSLPLLELYIDNQPGGSNELFYEGANINFENDFYWNKFLKISGWWVKIFEPESKKKNLLNIDELALKLSDSTENVKLKKNGDKLELRISKEEINSLAASKIVVLVGSFDPFGLDHFRSLSKKENYWQIYSKSKTDLSSSTRVLDILVAGGKSQQEILKGEMPTVPYLIVDTSTTARKKSLVDILKPVNQISLTLLLLYIVVLVLIIYKFKDKR